MEALPPLCCRHSCDRSSCPSAQCHGSAAAMSGWRGCAPLCKLMPMSSTSNHHGNCSPWAIRRASTSVGPPGGNRRRGSFLAALPERLRRDRVAGRRGKREGPMRRHPIPACTTAPRPERRGPQPVVGGSSGQQGCGSTRTGTTSRARFGPSMRCTRVAPWARPISNPGRDCRAKARPYAQPLCRHHPEEMASCKTEAECRYDSFILRYR